MCTFKITNDPEHYELDTFLKLGGPDLSKTIEKDGIFFTHHLLSITGNITPQPIEHNGKLFMLLGEIYNWDRSYPSDIYTAINAYEQHGYRFTEYLDGEFLIIVYEDHKIHFFNDPWSTRMTWFEQNEKRFIFSTFSLNKNSVRLQHNSHYCFDVGSNVLTLVNDELHKFDLTQYKNSFDDWIKAFDEAVAKRWHKNAVLALSGGVDSSAIAVSLAKQKLPVDFLLLDINQTEDRNTIRSVASFIYQNMKTHIDVINRKTKNTIPEEFSLEYNFLANYSFVRRPLTFLAKRTRDSNKKVLITGQGSDEILDNYRKKSYTRHSEKLEFVDWPDDLSTIFPWGHFYRNKQRYLIDSHETSSLCFGVEHRSPFLDKKLTQEWLWITPSLKNLEDKSPLKKYLRDNNIVIPNKMSGLIDQVYSKDPNIKPDYKLESLV